MDEELKRALTSRLLEAIEEVENECAPDNDINYVEGMSDGLLRAIGIIDNEF